ncbi:MAG: Uncharacterized protein XD50_0565 [Clostridia bacterium 41_269]|nr:MAG: Uncharacterized protein XD50_0565 [Clostridia bacterium 41_269]
MFKKRWHYFAAFLVLVLALLGPPLYSHFNGVSSDDLKNSLTLKEVQKPASVDEEKPEEKVTAQGNEVSERDQASFEDKRESSGSTAGHESRSKEGFGSKEGQQKKDFSEQKRDLKDAEKSGGTKVWIAVVGKNGELLFGPSFVTLNENSRWGITALGALEATGLSFTISPLYGDFVTSVEGQKNEGMSGWMYKVNDRIPSISAGKMSVKGGDKIIWWYSAGSNFRGPSWDSLKP